MVSFPPCKINLGLQILTKRADGYHNLSTCFYPVPWTDILEIIKSDSVSFSSTGLPIPGSDNLCIQAYQLLKKDFNLPPVKIHLHKIIPIGAGLGGGSSDAAHMLKVLNTIFNLGLTSVTLYEYASRLGSDCAFFIQDSPMLGSERGEVLSKIAVNLKDNFLIIVKPDIHIATAEAYAGVIPRTPSQTIENILGADPSTWKTVLKNDFEESIFKKYPQIKEIKDKLYAFGAMYASMSGSGSSVFGIFEKEIKIPAAFQGAQVWSGFL